MNWPWKRKKNPPHGEQKEYGRILHENPEDKDTEEYIKQHEKEKENKK